MIIVFTGNGKGKTTAASGQMVRIIGRGKKALMIQFIKGPWRSGEDDFAKKFNIPKSKFQIRKMGLGFVGILGDALPRSRHKKAARDALQCFETELKKGSWDLIVLDEINKAAKLRLVSVRQVFRAIKNVPIKTVVILTGRDASREFIRRADLVTEMREVQHPYNYGKIA